jgi:hypothetical protein
MRLFLFSCLALSVLIIFLTPQVSSAQGGWVKLGPIQRINSILTGNQFLPAVAVGEADYQIYVWAGYPNIYKRAFLPTGAPYEPDVLLEGGYKSDVAANRSGQVVIIWDTQNTPIKEIRCQRYHYNVFPDGGIFTCPFH